MRAPIAAVLLVVGSLQLRAQETEIRPGARIRLSAPGIVAERYVGTVLTRTTDTVVVGGPERAPIAIPLARITAVEVSHGKSHGRGALAGTAWGAGIGAALGIVTMGGLTQCGGTPRTCDLPASSGEKQSYVGFLAFGGVFYGSIIGALVGREEWDRFDLTPRAAVVMRDGRPGVSVSIRM